MKPSISELDPQLRNSALTYRPSMYYNEGLCFWVEFALRNGLWPAGHNVAHVIIWDVCSAQGELGDDVSVVCDPLSCGGQRSGSDGAVYCCSAHTHTHKHAVDEVFIAGEREQSLRFSEWTKTHFYIVITHFCSITACMAAFWLVFSLDLRDKK